MLVLPTISKRKRVPRFCACANSRYQAVSLPHSLGARVICCHAQELLCRLQDTEGGGFGEDMEEPHSPRGRFRSLRVGRGGFRGGPRRGGKREFDRRSGSDKRY